MRTAGRPAAEDATAGRVVAVGGGHGLARVLTALRGAGAAPTAVVTVADDGGSSGRLRRDLGIIAPGDLRMALLALARHEELAAVLGHRFERGQLSGHALGNLALVALAEQTGGDFVAALRRAGALLDCAGEVLPSTTVPVHLRGCVDGRRVDGQARVAASGGGIERVWLDPPDPPACAEAVAALRAADLVVLGPGSLFTSIIANLLVPDVAAALCRPHGPMVVYVANLQTQLGETVGFGAQAHVDAVLAHAPGLRLDVTVLHDGPLPEDAPGPVGGPVGASAGRVVTADLAVRAADGTVGPGHDPARLGSVLAPLVAEAAGRRATAGPPHWSGRHRGG